MKKLRIGIIGVFAFMFTSMFSTDFEVNAKSCSVKKVVFDFYDVQINWNKGNTYVISIEGTDKGIKDSDYFIVKSITVGKYLGKDDITKKKVSKGNSLELEIEAKKHGRLDKLKEVVVELELVNSDKYEKCADNDFTVEVTATKGEQSGKTGLSAEKLREWEAIYRDEIGSIRDDSIYTDTDTDPINIIEGKASNHNVLYNDKNNPKKLYCNPNIDGDTVTNTNSKFGNSKDAYYTDKNTKYFYHSKWQETSDSAVELVFNYSSTGEAKSKPVNICGKTKCEEAVKVEYGPPVASMAGLCFEYSVRITSYVKCSPEITYTAEELINDLNTSYCTPSPVCSNRNGYVGKQGGPNEDFESCVQECDGGKYSRKCSNKCYKKVYGNLENNKLDLAFMNDIEVSKLVNTNKDEIVTGGTGEDCIDNAGCYYRDGDDIKWKAKTNKKGECIKDDCQGRWYTENDYNIHWYGYESYYTVKNGFWKAVSGGRTCSDNCKWVGCDGYEYLNPEQAKLDAQNNWLKIKDAVKSCKAKANCKTTTNTVTIKANYATYSELKTGGNISASSENYSECNTKHNYTASFGGATVNSNNKEGTSVTFNNKDNIIIDSDACYNKNSTDAEKYLTEWTFPGTYLNAKNNATTFNKNEAGTGYLYYDKKFCLPANIASVNTTWFDKFINEGKVEGWNENDSRINQHNIIATARTFGYFGWNFDINCFFGVNNAIFADENSSGTNSSGINSDKCIKTLPRDNYSFRIVDKDDLFAGRNTIGNNWTSNAQNPKLASGYDQNPEDIAQAIKEGRDSNVDYVFDLDKKALSELKNYKDDYSQFKDNFTLKNNSVYCYESPLITTKFSSSRKTQLGVNNQYK